MFFFSKKNACLISLFLTSCITPEISQTASQSYQIKNPFLWKVGGKSADCFLFGTIHSGHFDILSLPPQVNERMDDSQLFFVEMAEDAPRNKLSDKLITSLLKDTKLPVGESLEKKLSEKAWNQLKKKLPNDFEWLNNSQPWIANVWYENEFGNDPAFDIEGPKRSFLDFEIEQFAKNKKLPVVSLDANIDLTTAILALIDVSFDYRRLQEKLERDFDNRSKQNPDTKYLKPYIEGDISFFQSDLSDSIELKQYENAVGERNRIWIEVLKKNWTTETCFIAVGIGHMTGPKSLLILLKKEGYRVEQMN